MSDSDVLFAIADRTRYAAVTTMDRLFSNESLWNQRRLYVPIDPLPMPTSPYFYAPQVVSYGNVGVWVASPSDGPMWIYPQRGELGDSTRGSVSYGDPFLVSHWPVDTQPARSGDGWACVIDGDTLYSFIELTKDGDLWRARNVAYGSVRDSGWGTAARPYVGVCAAGTSPAAGLMRTKDMADLTIPFPYALRLNVGYQVAKAGPVAPAFAQDANYGAYTGRWPLGGLVMVDPHFNVATINDARLRKAAMTMQTYGAFIVDTCDYVPWQLCGERDSGFDMNYDDRAETAKLTAVMRLCSLD